MINVCQTYEIVTYESAEHGEAEERGFHWKDKEHSFRELIELMESHPEASNSGKVDSNTWFSSYPESDFRTGDSESTAIHFSRSNPERNRKYWIKAADYVARKERERREKSWQAYQNSRSATPANS